MITEAEHARQRVEDMLRASLAEFGLGDDASVRDLADMLQGTPSNEVLTAGIEAAKTFYIDAKGHQHRIADMPNGYIHNAVGKLKRVPATGLVAFTILAMDAEIERRKAAEGEEDDHG